MQPFHFSQAVLSKKLGKKRFACISVKNISVSTVMILSFSDRWVWANRADPDLSSLFAIPFASFIRNTLRFGLDLCFNFRSITAKFLGV